MTKTSFAAHPFLLGFEQLERMVERGSKNDGYPPFNIEQVDGLNYRITLAVAGFAQSDLSIVIEDGQLLIQGAQTDTGETRTYLHRGIAARQFQRSFVLAKGVEVSAALLENGLLHVELQRHLPESTSRTIQINGKG